MLEHEFKIRTPSGVVHIVKFSKKVHISTCDSKVGTAEMGRLGSPAYKCPASARHCDLGMFYPTLHALVHSIQDAAIFGKAYEYVVQKEEKTISDAIRRNKSKYAEELARIKANARIMCGGISGIPALAQLSDGRGSGVDLDESYGLHAVLHPDVNFIKRWIFLNLQLAKCQLDLSKSTHTESQKAYAAAMLDAHGKTDCGTFFSAFCCAQKCFFLSRHN